jgi:phosphate transport system substrate-binding protein
VACKKPVYDDVSVYQHIPFSEKSENIKLEEVSTLKLINNLPKLDGATALYPLYASFVEAVYPIGEYPYYGKWNEDYTKVSQPIVTSSRTAKAYENLIKGKVDIIFCAKPSEDEIKMAKENDIEFHITPIGKEAFVFFNNRRNKVVNLTTDQIIGIYTGKITNWSELGGKNNKIRVYQREENSGSQTMLKTIMGNNQIISPLKNDALDLMLDIVSVTSTYKNYNDAIGYSFLFYTTEMVRNNEIKLLEINGIKPNRKTIISGEYPYSDYFYAITVDTKNENVDKFIDWILSKQGQYIVDKLGYVSIE